MKKHAQHKKDEPGKIYAPEIWKYIQMSQKESIQKRNNSRFRESCLAEKSRTLHAWNRTESAIDRHGIRIDRSYTLELRYDLDNNLLGGWDSRGEIIGDRVLSGFRPIDELPPFFSDEYILPCRDNEDKLNLVEFRPDNYATYSATEPQHFSITKPEKIIEHGSLQSVDGREIDYYLINERHTHRLLHSAFDQGMRSDEPIQTIDVDGDRLFIGNSGDYYVGRTTIISL